MTERRLRLLSPLTEDTVLSCPACWSWQLHYTALVAAQWEPKVFEAMVEAILREHVATECPQPRLFHTLAKSRGLV